MSIGTTERDTELLATLESRLRKALAVVGERRVAVEGATNQAEEAVYCEGFCDALRYLFGTEAEAQEVLSDVTTCWNGPALTSSHLPGELADAFATADIAELADGQAA